jgi:hypothetical protein
MKTWIVEAEDEGTVIIFNVNAEDIGDALIEADKVIEDRFNTFTIYSIGEIDEGTSVYTH